MKNWFIENELFTNSYKIYGAYNTKYKYSSDYDLFFKMIVKFKMKGMATSKNEVMGYFGLKLLKYSLSL